MAYCYMRLPHCPADSLRLGRFPKTQAKEGSMGTFFDDVIEQVAAVNLDGLTGPEAPVAETEGERVLGTMSPRLRAIWAVRNQYWEALKARRQALEAFRRGNQSPDPSQENPLIVECQRADTRFKAANEGFWASVDTEFPHTDPDEDLAVRQGWQVVARPSRKMPEIIAVAVEVQRQRSKGGFLDLLLGRWRHPG